MDLKQRKEAEAGNARYWSPDLELGLLVPASPPTTLEEDAINTDSTL